MILDDKNTELLNDLHNFDAENPDFDVEFIESLSECYFRPSSELVNLLLKFVKDHSESPGMPIIMSLIYKTAMEVPDLDEDVVQEIFELEKSYKDKSHLARHFACLFWCKVYEVDVPGVQIRQELMDKCVQEYVREDNTVYCRRQMAKLLFKLTKDDPTDAGVTQLMNAVVGSQNDMIIDGLADVLLEPEIFAKLLESTDHAQVIVSKCEGIVRAEGRTCKLVGALLAADEQFIKMTDARLAQFACPSTANDVLFEVCKILLPKMDQREGSELFSKLCTLTDNQIDYVIPFFERFYQGDELMQKLQQVSDQLCSPYTCSSENMRLFFEICSRHCLNPTRMQLLLGQIGDRLRKFPSEVLKKEIMNVPGAVDFLQKKSKEFLASTEATTFDSGLQIASALCSQGLEVGTIDIKDKILEKVFQQEDMFLSKDATAFLSQRHPQYLTENAIQVFDAKTDQQIRIHLIRGVVVCMKELLNNPATNGKTNCDLRQIAGQLISKVCHLDDDAHVRMAALELANTVDISGKDIEMLQTSADEYNSYKVNRKAFYDDSRARLDDLILTSKLKNNGCENCIAKECY